MENLKNMYIKEFLSKMGARSEIINNPSFDSIEKDLRLFEWAKLRECFNNGVEETDNYKIITFNVDPQHGDICKVIINKDGDIGVYYQSDRLIDSTSFQKKREIERYYAKYDNGKIITQKIIENGKNKVDSSLENKFVESSPKKGTEKCYNSKGIQEEEIRISGYNFDLGNTFFEYPNPISKTVVIREPIGYIAHVVCWDEEYSAEGYANIDLREPQRLLDVTRSEIGYSTLCEFTVNSLTDDVKKNVLNDNGTPLEVREQLKLDMENPFKNKYLEPADIQVNTKKSVKH